MPRLSHSDAATGARRIWMRYGVELHELIREQRSPPTDADIDDIEGGF
jgi:hypothetical protein